MYNKKIKSKKYDHIMHLGNNCEAAFHFVKNFGFVEPHLFTWASVKNEDKFLQVLSNPDNIFRRGMKDANKTLMYQCPFTDIYFHSRDDLPTQERLNTDISIKEIIMDMFELNSRIAHFKNKFHDMAKSKKKKLYILKEPSTPKFVKKVFKTLEKINSKTLLGFNTFELLAVVTDEQAPEFMRLDKKNRNIHIRSVEHFAPICYATHEDKNDMEGWKNIYAEFQPKVKKARNKKFKFEK